MRQIARALGVHRSFSDDALGYFTKQLDPTRLRHTLFDIVGWAKRGKVFQLAPTRHATSSHLTELPASAGARQRAGSKSLGLHGRACPHGRDRATFGRRPRSESITLGSEVPKGIQRSLMSDVRTVTQILSDARGGSRNVVDEIVPVLYEELGQAARAHLRRSPGGGTLDTCALIHEAYLRLVDQTGVVWKDRVCFLAYAARAMRSVLLDHARRQRRAKRGGGVVPVTLREADALVGHEADTIIAIEDALARLESEQPRLARVVECRFFGGMAEEETAAALGVSDRTVRRDWLKAKAWLQDALR